MKNNILWAVFFFLPCAMAWWGMDFSPSFTMMFLTAQLICCAVSYLLTMFTRHTQKYGKSAEHTVWSKPLLILSGVLFVIGVAFSVPSVYIYAAGEDYLNLFFKLSPFAGFAMAALIGFWKKWKGLQRISLTKSAGNWLLAWAGIFATLCGWRSPGILPYGIGLMLYLLGWNQENGKRQRVVIWLSLMMISLTSALPGICQ